APSIDVLGGINFPDPGLFQDNGVSYAFGTVDGAGNNVPVVSNGDFSNTGGWSGKSEAFPAGNEPSWAKQYTSWAPDVVQVDFDPPYAMYYAAEIQGSGGQPHCIGFARSKYADSGYFDGSTSSFICPSDQGGAIDPEGFTDDDGSVYVLYKIDTPFTGGGPCASTNREKQTPIMLQPLTSDGYTFNGDAQQIYYNVEGVGIEAPSITKQNGVYFLFFAVGCYATNEYRTDYVTATDIRGPYGNRQTLVQTGDFGLYGPGGLDVLPNGQCVFHSLKTDNNISDGRVMNTGTLSFSGTTATLN
ncbi:glycoside hydrolase family 43 protein, partial [Polychaeton citri CBS 116435]